MSGAAIAWAQLQHVSIAQLSSGCEGSGLLAEAVDAAAAQGLAALVPAQLLRAASTALQARLAQLRSTLSAVDNGLVAIGVGEHRGEDGEAEEQPGLPEEVEGLLVEVLRVSRGHSAS